MTRKISRLVQSVDAGKLTPRGWAKRFISYMNSGNGGQFISDWNLMSSVMSPSTFADSVKGGSYEEAQQFMQLLREKVQDPFWGDNVFWQCKLSIYFQEVY